MKFLLLSLCICLPMFIVAQSKFSMPLELQHYSKIASIRVYDSTYYLTALSEPTGSSGFGGILKFANISTEGEIIWEEDYSNGIYMGPPQEWGNQGLYKHSETEVYLAGNHLEQENGYSDGFLMKTNIQGDSIWMKTYGSPFSDLIGGVESLNDSTLLIYGNYNKFSSEPSQIWAFAVDLEGNVLWERFYAGEYGFVTQRDIAVLENGNIVILYNECLSYGSCGSGVDKRLRLLCIDAEGNELWTTTLAEYYLQGALSSNVIELDNGQFLVSFFREIGQGIRRPPILLWVSPNGEVLQQYSFDEYISLSNYITDLFLTESGNIIGLGVLDTSIEGEFYGGVGWVFSMTQSGELNWERMFLDNSGNFHIGVLHCGLETDEGGLVFGGYLEDSISFKHTAWLLKLDSAGCYHPNCEEGLQFVDVEEIAAPTSSVSAYRAYPNPISKGAVLQLEALVDTPQAARAQWLDAYGRQLAEHALDPLPLQNIPVGDWPPGVYFLRLMEESGRALQVLRVLVE
jgi:hypothetical protein